jgi:hypothetical protein
VGRYYKIAVSAADPNGLGTGGSGQGWTNQVNGKSDPNAQQVELDIPVAGYAQPAGPALPHIRVWGVGLAAVNQAASFFDAQGNGAAISVYGGMQTGLPLASAAAGQAGLLVSGTVFQAFANFQGINQTLDLVIQPGPPGGTQDQPAGLSFKWKKGTQLSAVIKQALAQAYPGVTANVNVSSALVLPADEAGVYGTLPQFGNYIKQVSQQILGGNYSGVDIVANNGVFNVFDGTNVRSPKPIKFQDLVGQVTWIGPFEITWNTVMRSDIAVGDVVALPSVAQFQSVTTQATQSQSRSQPAFQGSWLVSFVRHIGNSRAPDASAWITNFRASALSAPQFVNNPLGETTA